MATTNEKRNYTKMNKMDCECVVCGDIIEKELLEYEKFCEIEITNLCRERNKMELNELFKGKSGIGKRRYLNLVSLLQLLMPMQTYIKLLNCFFSSNESNDEIVSTFLNIEELNKNIVPTVVYLQFHLEKAQIELDRVSKNYAGNPDVFLDDEEIDRAYRKVAEVQEEYEDCKQSIYEKAVLVLPDVRRWVFHTFKDRELTSNVSTFASLYNDWTVASAEYLIIQERKQHDYTKFESIIKTIDDKEKKSQLVEAMKQVDAEYTQKLKLQKELLSAYVSDMYASIDAIEKRINAVHSNGESELVRKRVTCPNGTREIKKLNPKNMVEIKMGSKNFLLSACFTLQAAAGLGKSKRIVIRKKGNYFQYFFVKNIEKQQRNRISDTKKKTTSSY